MNCTYCGAKFTCGCQKVRLSTGVVVCKACSKRNLGRDGLNNKPIRQNEKVKQNERSRSVHN